MQKATFVGTFLGAAFEMTMESSLYLNYKGASRGGGSLEACSHFLLLPKQLNLYALRGDVQTVGGSAVQAVHQF
jgi:hypothetical protein